MAKHSIEKISRSKTPFFDVFGVEVRPRGRPTGAFLDYETSLEMPAAKYVEDRVEAGAVRARVKSRALAVLQALYPEELKAIYKAELALELERMGGTAYAGRPDAAAAGETRAKLISEDDAKAMPGSGLLPGETYWDWMNTYGSKDDAQWESEKVTVKANIDRVMKGGSDG